MELMNMKGIKGMLAVAKTAAIERGVRGIPTPDDKVVYGYLLKNDELHAVFKQEGFRKLTTENSYVDTWLEIGKAVKVEWRQHPAVYFFVLQSTDSIPLRDLMDCKQEHDDNLEAETYVYVGTEVLA